MASIDSDQIIQAPDLTAPPRTPRGSVRPKHDSFDAYWSRHSGLVYWMAKRLARKYATPYEELVGSLVIHFNDVLYSFVEGRGSKFNTWFCRSAQQKVIDSFLRHDSESWDVRAFAAITTDEVKREAHASYATHEQLNRLYHIPEREGSWVREILESFGSAEECWAFLTRELDGRGKYILEQRLREGRSLQDIGDALHISKERVRQLEARAIGKIRDRVRVVEGFAELFAGRGEEK